MKVVQCDVVRCKYNEKFLCTLEKINLRLSHVSDSNGVDYTVIIKCEQQEIIKNRFSKIPKTE